MVTLNFTLNLEAVARIHDILTCLARFSENVSLEARHDSLSLTTLNSSKTTYASFSLSHRFFTSYECIADARAGDARFTCRMLNKAMLTVFKGKTGDARGRETAIDSCEVSVQDRADETECRLIVRMVCNQGVTKIYRLTYEAVEVMHALFDKNLASNYWSMHSAVLREFSEYFGPKTEQLDVYVEDDRVVFTSFTDKISNGKEIFKHPLRTAVSANRSDFERFDAQDRMHIIISVRDFKAVISHAETYRATITAKYSQPTRPLQFSYSADGIMCEYTLMTSGDYRSNTASAPMTTVAPERTAVTRSQSGTTDDGQQPQRTMPPPAVPTTRLNQGRPRAPGSAKSASGSAERTANFDQDPDPESLFIPEQADARWDPANYDAEEEETLGWDASASHVRSISRYPSKSSDRCRIRDCKPLFGTAVQRGRRVDKIKMKKNWRRRNGCLKQVPLLRQEEKEVLS